MKDELSVNTYSFEIQTENNHFRNDKKKMEITDALEMILV